MHVSHVSIKHAWETKRYYICFNDINILIYVCFVYNCFMEYMMIDGGRYDGQYLFIFQIKN